MTTTMKTDNYKDMTEEDNEFLNQWIDERLAEMEEEDKSKDYYQETFDFIKPTEDKYIEL